MTIDTEGIQEIEILCFYTLFKLTLNCVTYEIFNNMPHLIPLLLYEVCTQITSFSPEAQLHHNGMHSICDRKIPEVTVSQTECTQELSGDLVKTHIFIP